MKKDVWSNVYYRLNDPVKIRLAVLYTLKYVDFPMSSIELRHIMLDATTVDYIELCEIIEVLMQENHVKLVRRDEKDKYDITDSGRELLSMFETDLLPSVRQSIRKSADEYFKEEFKKSQIISELVPDEDGTYYLDVSLSDGKKKLFSLSVFAGSRQNAMDMKRVFNESPTQMFKDILSLFRKNNESE